MTMARVIPYRVDVSDSPSDEVIRERMQSSDCPNGCYAYWVCSGCGEYRVSLDPEGLEIVKECRECVEVKP